MKTKNSKVIQEMIGRANQSIANNAELRHKRIQDIRRPLQEVYRNESAGYFVKGSYNGALQSKYEDISKAQDMYNLGITATYSQLAKSIEELVKSNRSANPLSLADRIAVMGLVDSNLSLDTKLQILGTVEGELGTVDLVLQQLTDRLDPEDSNYSEDFTKLNSRRDAIKEVTGELYLDNVKALAVEYDKTIARDVKVTDLDNSLYAHVNKISLDEETGAISPEYVVTQSFTLGTEGV